MERSAAPAAFPCAFAAARRIATLAVAAGLAVAVLPAAAQTPPLRGALVWSGAFGGFNGEDNPGKLTNQRSDYAGYGGIGWRVHPNLVLEAEVPFHGQRYDTPPTIVAPAFGTVDGRVTVDTMGLSVGPKFLLPLGRVDLFAGGGAGYYWSRFRATGTSFGLAAELNETDSGLGAHAKAGFDVAITRSISVGAEYRRLWLDADFGTASRGRIDIGGDFYFVTVRGRF